MKRLSREFKIGVFGVAMLSLLYFAINFVLSNRLFNSDQMFYAIFNKADGIEASAPVMTKGFRIGTVDRVELELPSQKIVVSFSVNKNYPLPKDSRVVITTSGLLGGTIMDVDFGDDHSQYFASGDTVTSRFEPGMIQLITEEYETVKNKLEEYTDKIDGILAGVESLFDSSSVNSIKGALANTDRLTGELARVMSARSANLERTLINLDRVTASVSSMSNDLENTVENFSAASESMPEMMKDAAQSMEDLRSILTSIESGDGNLAKLINDGELYENLAGTLGSLDLLLEDIQADPKKYVQLQLFSRRTKEEKFYDRIRVDEIKDSIRAAEKLNR